jgi:tRNA threonylcarbamoyladenosine biosynthesis protein TsaB
MKKVLNASIARNLLKFLEEKTGDLHLISGIGVMKGPGSFTGLRIGLTVVNTLADSLNIPIVGAMGDNWRDLLFFLRRKKVNHKYPPA